MCSLVLLLLFFLVLLLLFVFVCLYVGSDRDVEGSLTHGLCMDAALYTCNAQAFPEELA